MTDRISKEHRSWNMSRIRSKDTKPELLLRSMLFAEGYRFRLAGKVSKRIYKKGVLPGRPDIVLAKYRTVIFVHGCFWHRHENCSRATTPKSNTEFWLAKFAKNIARDKENISELRTLGWNVIVIWECELMKYPEKVLVQITEKLAEYARKSEIKRSVSYSCDEPANIPYAAESSAEYGRKKT
jgi:DNA mismatch endonuclease (patch repair protein)